MKLRFDCAKIKCIQLHCLYRLLPYFLSTFSPRLNNPFFTLFFFYGHVHAISGSHVAMDDAMAVQVNHGQHALDGHVDDVLRQQRRAQFGGRGAGADLRLRIDSARPAVDQKSTRVINKKVS